PFSFPNKAECLILYNEIFSSNCLINCVALSLSHIILLLANRAAIPCCPAPTALYLLFVIVASGTVVLANEITLSNALICTLITSSNSLSSSTSILFNTREDKLHVTISPELYSTTISPASVDIV